MLIVASLDMNEDEDVKLNAWLGIPLLLVVISYTVTGIIEKAPKQTKYGPLYTVSYSCRFHIDLQARKIRKYLLMELRQELLFLVY